MHGYVGLIVPVRTADAASAVLKLSWPHDEALDEAVALGAWNGRGAVRLLDHDAESYVLLLERLDPARSLNTEPIEEAVTIAGGLLRRLAVAGPPLHRSLSEVAERWQQELPADAARLGNTVPTRVVDEAVARCRDRSDAQFAT
jgi:streptomycin 6-kinase